MRARFASVLCVVIVVAACGDDPDPNAAKDAAIDANAKALCNRFFGCCTEAELADLPFVGEKSPPSLAGCIALHQQNGRLRKPEVDDAAAAGRVVLRLERNDACVAEVEALSCRAFHARVRNLRFGDAYGLCTGAVVEPLVADGAPCTTYYDCRSGSCDAATCKPFPAEGDPCVRDGAGCAVGLRCNPDTLRCQALVEKGGDCDSDDACVSGACRSRKCTTPGRCGG